MRYFYLSRNEIKQGNILVYDVFNTEIPLLAYRTAPNKEDAIQYIGENIPNDIEYDEENDVLFSAKDRPSPYHVFIKGVWVVKDKEKFKIYCAEIIDKIKAEVLEFGFYYQGHRQRCRDKDIAFMVATVVSLQTAKNVLGKDKTVSWYFEDNCGIELDLVGMGTLMMYGSTFVQSVYDTESYFKNLEEPKIVTKEEFEEKRKELHQKLVEQ